MLTEERLSDSLRIVRGLGTNLLYVEDDEGSIRLDAAEAERLAIALIQATPVPATMDGKADADEALVFIDSDGPDRAIAYAMALIRAARAAKEAK